MNTTIASHHHCLAFTYPVGDDWHSAEKLWSLTGPAGEILVPVSGPMTINSSAGLYQAVLTGMGIVMLVPILETYKLPCQPMNLIYAQDRYRRPKLCCFVEFALQQWGKP